MKIRIRNNGPLRLELGEGESFDFCDSEDRAYGLGERRAVSLCRCGRSQKKPFCDGSHNDGFDSICEAYDL